MPFNNPDFALYPQGRTSIPILGRRIDGFPVEEHRLDLATTENPIESGSTLVDNAVKRQERLRLEGWVSDLLPAPGMDQNPDRAADAYAAIVQLFNERTPVTAVTALRVYENMLITRCVAPVDKRTGRALKFTMDLTQVLFSDTDLARFPPDVVAEDGPAAERTTELDGGDRTSLVVPPVQERLSLVPTTPAPAFNIPQELVDSVLRQARDRGIRIPRLVTQQLALTGDVNQTFRTILGKQPVRIRHRWHPTDKKWYLGLYDQGKHPIATGLRLVESGRPLQTYAGDFAGELYVEGGGEPTRDAFTSSHRLLYVGAQP